MYAEHDIDFKCPHCGNDVLVRVRTNVTIKESITKVSVSDSNSGGKTYSILTGWDGQDNGKVERFECSACGFVLRSKKQPFKSKTPSPIKSAKQLFDWVKRNLNSHDHQASKTC